MPPGDVESVLWTHTVMPAAAQGSSVGRQIHRLTLHDGRLYPSFGDYGDNLGPIALVSLDTATPDDGFGAAELTAQTEQTWRGRTLNGDLVFPYLDPKDSGSGAYARRTGTSWSVGRFLSDPQHLFDMAATSEGLWAVGAWTDDRGTIWHSTDDGATWTVSLQINVHDFSRFYSIVAVGNDLLAFGQDQQVRALHRPEGGTWTDLGYADPLITVTSDAQVQQRTDGPVVLMLNNGVAGAQAVSANVRVEVLPGAEELRGQTVSQLHGITACDLTITPDGETAYFVNGTDVHRLGPSGSVVTLRTLPTAATSIAVDDDNAYFGTADSTVYAVALADLEP